MEEKVATLESLEDETQSGNMRESFSLEKVTLMSGILRRSLEEKIATLESLEDETSIFFSIAEISWIPRKNVPLDEHKQSKRGNQQTMQEPLNKRKTGNMIYERGIVRSL